jgi:hypothetical protein
MTSDEAEKIKSYITEAVQEAFKGCNACPIPAEVSKEIGHLSDSIKSVGDGDMAHGIERIRENHRFIMKYRKLSERIGNIVLGIIVMAVLTGLVALASAKFLMSK